MKYPQLVPMPSAVSDWLEEQLEACGIDAVVYTRYILSLLRPDPHDDFTASDSDFYGREQTKAAQQNASDSRGQKRVRGWDGRALSPNQLKRSAVVECLLSASEQRCGIESLVDELCMKLEQIENKSDENLENSSTINTPKISAEELAQRYYTDFPPLGTSCRLNQSLNPLTQQFYEPFPSLFSKSIDLVDINNCSTRIMAKSAERSEGISLWDEQVLRYNQLNNLRTDEVDKKEFAREETIDDKVAKLVAKFDSKIEALWKDENHNENPPDEEHNQLLQADEDDYQDVPVDFHELLSSPSDEQPSLSDLVSMFEKDSFVIQKPKTFIQCGTNIFSSIWSQPEQNESFQYFDNYNHLKNEQIAATSFWNDENITTLEQHKTNNLFVENSPNLNNVNNNIGNEDDYLKKNFNWEDYDINRRKWSEAENVCSDLLKTTPENIRQEENFSVGELKTSFSKLNHNKEISVFEEVNPKNGPRYVFPQVSFLRAVSYSSNTKQLESNQDDLLTSKATHFCPINIDGVKPLDSSCDSSLADGYDFKIHASPDKVNYRRTRSGTMFLESDTESPKEYMEFKGQFESDDDDEYTYKGNGGSSDEWSDDERTDDEELCCARLRPSRRNFVLKFRVRQNEKCCQTDEEEIANSMLTVESPNEVVPAKRRVLSDELFFPGDEELVETLDTPAEGDDDACTYNTNDEMSLFVKCEMHDTCERCDAENNGWSSRLYTGLAATSDLWSEQIWHSNETLCSHRSIAPEAAHSLRDELRQEGEQLLSDISSLQRLYFFDLSTNNGSVSSIDTERSSNSREERKRRHSFSLRPHTLTWWQPTHLKALRSLTF